MSRQQNLSVIERFNQPVSAGKYASQAKRESSIEQSIKHDIEKLLNTRSMFSNLSNKLEAVDASCIGYGMVDFLELSNNAKIKQEDVCSIVQKIIEKHEKRLKNILVSLADDQHYNNLIAITITAEIDCNNNKQQLVFESFIEPNKQRFSLLKGINI